jgi:protein MpaA
MSGRRLNHLAAILWMLNIAICVIVAGAFFWFNSIPTAWAGADDPNAPLFLPFNGRTLTPKPSITPVPPPTRRPTITVWPTPSPGPSVTPMVIPPANRRVIGYSVENRPLEVFRFGNGVTIKLIVAGIHGGYEHNTVELADELIAYLNDHPERIPADTTLYILRDMNPDGYARDKGVDGRANAHGVDLNRNFPYNWQADWPRDGCWIWRPITGGEYGGSEPEVQAVMAFIDSLSPYALISYHSAALGIFAGGRPDFPPSIKLAEDVSEVSNYPWPPINTGCDYTGNLTDWAANTRGIPSIDIELTNHSDTDFNQNLRVLQVLLSWKR